MPAAGFGGMAAFWTSTEHMLFTMDHNNKNLELVQDTNSCHL